MLPPPRFSSTLDYARLMGFLIKRMRCLLQLCVSKCPDRFATLLDAWNTKNWEYYKQFCKPGFEIGSKVRHSGQRSALPFCKLDENRFIRRHTLTRLNFLPLLLTLFKQITFWQRNQTSSTRPDISAVIITRTSFECALLDGRKWASITQMHITAPFCRLAAVQRQWR